MIEKPILWSGSSREDIRAFPEDARRQAGHSLHLVQHGMEPPDRKLMTSVGVEGIYVLHAFEKRTRRTPKGDIDLARDRLSRLIRERRTR